MSWINVFQNYKFCTKCNNFVNATDSGNCPKCKLKLIYAAKKIYKFCKECQSGQDVINCNVCLCNNVKCKKCNICNECDKRFASHEVRRKEMKEEEMKEELKDRTSFLNNSSTTSEDIIESNEQLINRLDRELKEERKKSAEYKRIVDEKIEIESKNNNVIVETIKEEPKVEIPPVQDTSYRKCRSCKGISEIGPECNACLKANYRICPDCYERRIPIRKTDTICCRCSIERDKDTKKREEDKKFNWLNNFHSMNNIRDHLLDCKNCTKCERCEDCGNCEDCKKSIGLDDCVRCTSCEYCDDCKDCYECKECDNCKCCKESNHLTDCVQCSKCDELIKCFDCIRCFKCINCRNLTGESYMINNKKVTIEEYNMHIENLIR